MTRPLGPPPFRYRTISSASVIGNHEINLRRPDTSAPKQRQAPVLYSGHALTVKSSKSCTCFLLIECLHETRWRTSPQLIAPPPPCPRSLDRSPPLPRASSSTPRASATSPSPRPERPIGALKTSPPASPPAMTPIRTRAAGPCSRTRSTTGYRNSTPGT